MPHPVKANKKAPSVIQGPWRAWAVESVMDRLEIDDEWWGGESISRMCYQLVVDSGRVVIVYRDLIDGNWYQQNAG